MNAPTRTELQRLAVALLAAYEAANRVEVQLSMESEAAFDRLEDAVDAIPELGAAWREYTAARSALALAGSETCQAITSILRLLDSFARTVPPALLQVTR